MDDNYDGWLELNLQWMQCTKDEAQFGYDCSNPALNAYNPGNELSISVTAINNDPCAALLIFYQDCVVSTLADLVQTEHSYVIGDPVLTIAIPTPG